jgi:predicted class III extradiol MEMO1 family dioxygenase
VDEAVRAELLASPLFQRMGQGVDEDEHSIEMHLPYVAQVTLLFYSIA